MGVSERRLFGELRRVFFLLALTLTCLAATVFWLLREPYTQFKCEQEYLPSVGRALGFRIGEIVVPRYPQVKLLGFVEVDERGPMYAAGFREGDIPIGGVDVSGTTRLCDILRSNIEWYSRIIVTTSAHWPGPEPNQRELLVPKPPKHN
jgi:hypothetical protein